MSLLPFVELFGSRCSKGYFSHLTEVLRVDGVPDVVLNFVCDLFAYSAVYIRACTVLRGCN